MSVKFVICDKVEWQKENKNYVDEEDDDDDEEECGVCVCGKCCVEYLIQIYILYHMNDCNSINYNILLYSLQRFVKEYSRVYTHA